MTSTKNPAPHISVIIPVFNTAPWLPRCLSSVCQQTLENIEIICVNDGSNDESGAILEDFACSDMRVLPISLGRNQGVSVARNIGISVAQGEWLSFVDSDDALENDFYEKLYIASLQSNAEIIKGACWIERNSPEFIDDNINKQIDKNKFKFTSNFYSAIYSKKLIVNNSIKFPYGCSQNEDLVFLYGALLNTTHIKTVNNALYKHYCREESLSSSPFTQKTIEHVIVARNCMIDLLNSRMPSFDTNIYISEYYRILSYFYLLSEIPIKMEDRAYVFKAIATAAINAYKKCLEPERLLAEITKHDTTFCALIADSNEKELQSYLATSHIQRLRNKARARLVKPV